MNSSKAPREGAARRGRVRIIGGAFRGRRIYVAAQPGLRPTPDRVRETLFNWLGQRLDGLACLDLFAGSGALGFEAASRGAARVVMVESSRGAMAALRQAKAAMGAAQVELVAGDALAYAARCTERFDVVFLDPPFGQYEAGFLLGLLAACLAPRARVYLEGPRPLEPAGGWAELKRARAGQVSYQLMAWQPAGNAP